MVQRAKTNPTPGKLAVVQAFVNTAAGRKKRDKLRNVGELRRWLERRDLLGVDSELTLEDHAIALRARQALRSLLAAHNGGGHDPTVVERLAGALAGTSFELCLDADGSVRFEPLSPGIRTALGKLLAIVAVAQSAGIWSCLKVCADPECRTAFYDTSGKGKWCTKRCGDRNRARKFRRSDKGRSGRSRQGLVALLGLEDTRAE